ncbi:Protein N-acetyltransferase, RimJ/RimL family [Paenibacillus sp. 1_12]|uniref:GNAT family N-acetyltransferase n=1 Tax=Paenibacillus sp. 1_12 TaxID=1566278 RepID=UPI0008E63A21|nr:GNAT family N-acetyltransferase [Paenibacillus sp. 1_12]SFL34553.1 Protein N-acetyltransferase, RimJ/RimL family [Paenibacillus sp. 1_12]
MNLMIREAAMGDLKEIARMNKELIEDEHSQNPMQVDELEQRMKDFLSNNWSVDLLYSSEEIVGYALYQFRVNPFNQELKEVYLRQYFISRAHRNKGYGSEGIRLLIDQRFNAAEITIDVLMSNPKGMNFWKKVGFQPYCSTMKLNSREN